MLNNNTQNLEFKVKQKFLFIFLLLQFFGFFATFEHSEAFFPGVRLQNCATVDANGKFVSFNNLQYKFEFINENDGKDAYAKPSQHEDYQPGYEYKCFGSCNPDANPEYDIYNISSDVTDSSGNNVNCEVVNTDNDSLNDVDCPDHYQPNFLKSCAQRSELVEFFIPVVVDFKQPYCDANFSTCEDDDYPGDQKNSVYNDAFAFYSIDSETFLQSDLSNIKDVILNAPESVKNLNLNGEPVIPDKKLNASILARPESGLGCVYAYPDNAVSIEYKEYPVSPFYPVHVNQVFGKNKKGNDDYKFSYANSNINCVPIPSYASEKPTFNTPSIIAPVCFDHEQSVSQYSIKGRAKPFFPILMQCLEETFLNLFYKRNLNTGGISYTDADTANTIFARIRANLVLTIKGFMALYVVVMGFKFLMGSSQQIPDHKKLTLWFFKLSLVMYFAIGPGVTDWFLQIWRSGNELSIVALEAGFGKVVDNATVQSLQLSVEAAEQGVEAAEVALENALVSSNNMGNDINSLQEDRKDAIELYKDSIAEAKIYSNLVFDMCNNPGVVDTDFGSAVPHPPWLSSNPLFIESEFQMSSCGVKFHENQCPFKFDEERYQYELGFTGAKTANYDANIQSDCNILLGLKNANSLAYYHVEYYKYINYVEEDIIQQIADTEQELLDLGNDIILNQVTNKSSYTVTGLYLGLLPIEDWACQTMRKVLVPDLSNPSVTQTTDFTPNLPDYRDFDGGGLSGIFDIILPNQEATYSCIQAKDFTPFLTTDQNFSDPSNPYNDFYNSLLIALVDIDDPSQPNPRAIPVEITELFRLRAKLAKLKDKECEFNVTGAATPLQMMNYPAYNSDDSFTTFNSIQSGGTCHSERVNNLRNDYIENLNQYISLINDFTPVCGDYHTFLHDEYLLRDNYINQSNYSYPNSSVAASIPVTPTLVNPEITAINTIITNAYNNINKLTNDELVGYNPASDIDGNDLVHLINEASIIFGSISAELGRINSIAGNATLVNNASSFVNYIENINNTYFNNYLNNHTYTPPRNPGFNAVITQGILYMRSNLTLNPSVSSPTPLPPPTLPGSVVGNPATYPSTYQDITGDGTPNAHCGNSGDVGDHYDEVVNANLDIMNFDIDNVADIISNAENALKAAKENLDNAVQSLNDFKETLSIEGVSTGYEVCDFRNSNYPANYEHMKLWDMVDCRMKLYMGIGSNSSQLLAPQLIIILVGGLFTSYFIVIPLLSLILFICIFQLCVRISFIYLYAFLSFVLMMFMSPIFIVAVLFEPTKSFFEGWLKQVMASIFQPIILFIFLSFAFFAIDAVHFGANKNFNGNYNIIKVIKDSCSDPNDFSTCSEVCRFGQLYAAYDSSGTPLNYSTTSPWAYFSADIKNCECIDNTALACIYERITTQEKGNFFLSLLGGSYLSLEFNGVRDYDLLLALSKMLLIIFVISILTRSAEEVSSRIAGTIGLGSASGSGFGGGKNIRMTSPAKFGKGMAQKAGWSFGKVQRVGGYRPELKGKEDNGSDDDEDK